MLIYNCKNIVKLEFRLLNLPNEPCWLDSDLMFFRVKY